MTLQFIDPRIVEQFNIRAPFKLTKGNLLVLARIGSDAHGTKVISNDPNVIQDEDYMGVVVPPLSYILGTDVWDETVRFQHEELDCCFHSFRKYIHLTTKANPDIMGLLWLREQDYVYYNPEWLALIDNRDAFSSQLCVGTFGGYAIGQLKKMEPGTTNGKMGEKRKRLVDKFGYDTKNAAHLIRLLKMLCDFLETQNLYVNRANIDGEFLKSSKRGEHSIETVKSWADELLENVKTLQEHTKL